MTWGDVDIKSSPMDTLFKKFGLEENTIDFLGHAVALHTSDDYRKVPALDTL